MEIKRGKIMKCIVCNKNIDRLGDTDYKPEVDMWRNAGVHEFIPGFGSSFDSRRFIICICDTCLTVKLGEGVIEKG